MTLRDRREVCCVQALDTPHLNSVLGHRNRARCCILLTKRSSVWQPTSLVGNTDRITRYLSRGRGKRSYIDIVKRNQPNGDGQTDECKQTGPTRYRRHQMAKLKQFSPNFQREHLDEKSSAISNRPLQLFPFRCIIAERDFLLLKFSIFFYQRISRDASLSLTNSKRDKHFRSGSLVLPTWQCVWW